MFLPNEFKALKKIHNFFPSSERKAKKGKKKDKKREIKFRKPTLKMDTWRSESTHFLVQKAKQKL
jgi:hypothetical protein